MLLLALFGAAAVMACGGQPKSETSDGGGAPADARRSAAAGPAADADRDAAPSAHLGDSCAIMYAYQSGYAGGESGSFPSDPCQPDTTCSCGYPAGSATYDPGGAECSGVCVKPFLVNVGDACGRIGNSVPTCAAPAFCNGGTCILPNTAPIGAPCRNSSDNEYAGDHVVCAAGLYCYESQEDFQCAALVAKGEPCTLYQSCVAGSSCMPSGDGGRACL